MRVPSFLLALLLVLAAVCLVVYAEPEEEDQTALYAELLGPSNCRMAKYPGVREFRELDLDEYKELKFRGGYVSVPRLVFYNKDDIPIARYEFTEDTTAEEISELMKKHNVQ